MYRTYSTPTSLSLLNAICDPAMAWRPGLTDRLDFKKAGMLKTRWETKKLITEHTVEPPNKKDTLGSAISSSVGRLSLSRRLKMYYCYGKGVQKSVLCREVVPFSEGPLSEVLLYTYFHRLSSPHWSSKIHWSWFVQYSQTKPLFPAFLTAC